ncbi:MAG: hypothetical protein ACT4NP_06205 [Pseudonocardiales bacterium]
MGGRHRPGRRVITKRTTTTQVVDISGQAHLLTDTAMTTGRGAKGRYVALCGTEVLPAALVAAPEGYCRSCHAATVPTQRRR